VFICGVMVKYTMDNGLEGRNMDLECGQRKEETLTSGNGKGIDQMDMECTHGSMVKKVV